MLVGGAIDAPADFRPGREQIVVGLPIIGQHMRDAVPYATRGLLLGRLIVPDLGWVWVVVGVLFFVQLLLNLLFPQATAAAAAVITERPLSTFMAGLLVLVLSGPVATRNSGRRCGRSTRSGQPRPRCIPRCRCTWSDRRALHFRALHRSAQWPAPSPDPHLRRRRGSDTQVNTGSAHRCRLTC